MLEFEGSTESQYITLKSSAGEVGMKKRNIWTFIAILAALSLLLYFTSYGKGQIKIDASGYNGHLKMHRKWRRKTVTISAGEPVGLRVGVYKPKLAIVRLTKNDDEEWMILSLKGPWGKLASIKVDRGKTTALSLGPPLVMRADVQHENTSVSIGLLLIGQAGEHWSPQVLVNKKPLPAPKLKIIDETGNVLASGNFEYG